MNQFDEKINDEKILLKLNLFTGYLNSMMNPLIYAYFNRDFRKAFRQTIKYYWKVLGFRKLHQCLGRYVCPCCVGRHSKESFTSETALKSYLSSEYINIEMTTMDHRAANPTI